jgi:thioredoxin-like negative regulator of GroEL
VIYLEDEIEELNDSTFMELLNNSDKFISVMFYTTTCPNCRAITPVYQELSRELKKDAIFTRINAQNNAGTSSQYGIMGVPTFKFFCKGQPIGEIVGAINATILRNTIKDLIRHKNECAAKTTKFSWEMDGYG